MDTRVYAFLFRQSWDCHANAKPSPKPTRCLEGLKTTMLLHSWRNIHHALVSSPAALPTNDPAAALGEIERASNQLHADGFAVTCNYHGVYLGDPSLNDVWAELNRLHAVVFIHPDAYAPASLGRPSLLIEVAFEKSSDCCGHLSEVFQDSFHSSSLVAVHSRCCRVVRNFLVLRWRRRCIWFRRIIWCMAQIIVSLARQSPPWSKKAVLDYDGLSKEQRDAIGRNALSLFPAATGKVGEERRCLS